LFKKVIFSTIILYAIFGFFLLPYILKSQIVKNIPKQLNAKLSIEDIYFNPFVFNLDISGVKLESLENKELISLKSIKFDLELYSLLTGSLHIKEFILDELKISAVYEKDKTINLLKILKQTKNEKKVESKDELELPRILIDRVAIVNGKVDYVDFTHKTEFDFSLNNIGFELRDIDTDNFDTNSASMRFYTTLGDGGFLDFKSEIIDIKPLKLKGSVNFEASKLYTQWRYLQDSFKVEVADGKLAFYADYSFNLDKLDDMLIENIKVSLDRLRIKPKTKYYDIFYLNNFHLDDAQIKPFKKYAHISNIAFDSINLKVKKDENGKIDWLNYLNQDTKKIDKNESIDSNSTSWDVRVDNFRLKKLKLNFEDSSVVPNVTTNLNELNLYLNNITLAGVEPTTYKIDLFVNKNFRCDIDGDIKYSILDLKSNIKCSGLDLIDYKSYIDDVARKSLKKYDIKLKNSIISFDTNLSLEEVDSNIFVKLKDSNLYVDNFALNKESTDEPLVRFNRFSVNGFNLDTKTKNIVIDKSTLNLLDIKTARVKDGSLNISDVVVPKKTKKKDSTANDEKYNLFLKHFSLQSAKVNFDDKLLKPSAKNSLNNINLDIYNIDSKKDSWLDYDLRMRVNSKGTIKTKGSLRHTPLKNRSTLELSQISLMELNPYLQQKAFVSIEDGAVNLKTDIEYSKSSKKPDLVMDGSFSLDKLVVNDSRDDKTILSFNQLNLESLNLELLPNKLYIDELGIDSFYVDAIIDENKTMNFTTLTKRVIKEDSKVQENNSTTTFPMKIMKTNVTNGNARFADLSLPIKFRTDIHDLNGVIYMISNDTGEISYVDIVGEVDKYGSTKLKGSISSSNPKIYTDIDFDFRNLELSSYSGYSSSFAGYKIDSGKLYLDLGYKILDSKLLSTNNIMIKNIKLGEAITEDTLPIGFVIALLEDSDGIIDIGMPIEGDLDEPDFKYGKLLVKTLGNLVVKAVTSPFRFLGSMMGIDGESLESLDFESGKVMILPPEKEKLDTLSKMMIKRPKISLFIYPSYDKNRDKLALQKQKLVKLVISKSGDSDTNQLENIKSIDILEDIYEEFKDDDKLDSIKESLEEEYKDEELDRNYLMAVINECINIQVVDIKELERLAKKRAEVLKSYLIDEKMIPTSSVIIGESETIDDDGKWIKTKLEIKVK